MATYNFRLTATGVAELKQQLEALGPAGAAAFQRIEGAAQASGQANSRFSQTITQAGFQLQDFAVQVQSGTSALTALAQQGSQFLGIFGAGGAIAGAGLAVAAVALQMAGLGQRTEEAKDSGKALADELKRSLDVLTGIETVSANVARNLRASTDARIAQAERSRTEALTRRPTEEQFVVGTRADGTAIVDRARLAQAQAEFARRNRDVLIEPDLLRAERGEFYSGETARTRQGDQLANEIANRDARARLDRERQDAEALADYERRLADDLAREEQQRREREAADRQRQTRQELDDRIRAVEAEERERQRMAERNLDLARRTAEREADAAAQAWAPFVDFPADRLNSPAIIADFEEALR